MSLFKNFIKPGILQGYPTVFEKFTSFIIFSAIGRYFGDSELGKLATVISIVGFLNLLSDIGLPTYIQRESSIAKIATQNLTEIVSIKIILTVLTFFGLLLFSNYYNDISFTYLIILFISISGITFSNIFQSKFLGENRNKEYFYSKLIPRIAMIFILILLLLSEEPNLIPFIYLFAAVSNLLIIFFYERKEVRFNFLSGISFSNFKSIINASAPIFGGYLFVFIYNRFDIILITYYFNTADCGIYFSSITILNSITLISSFYLTNFYTRLSKFYKSDTIKFRKEAIISLLFSLSISLVAFFVIYNFSEEIVGIIFGESFKTSAFILQTISFSLFFILLNYNFGVIFNSMNKSKIPMAASFIAVVVNVLLNLIYIPKYNMLAAIYVKIITEGILFFIFLINFLIIIWKTKFE